MSITFASGCLQESGNPAVDDLRERVAELVGINLSEFLEEGRGVGAGGQTQGGKTRRKVGIKTHHLVTISQGHIIRQTKI